MKALNEELINATQRIVDELWNGGYCCGYLHSWLEYSLTDQPDEEENISITDIDEMEEYLSEDLPEACNECYEIVDMIIHRLREDHPDW